MWAGCLRCQVGVRFCAPGGISKFPEIPILPSWVRVWGQGLLTSLGWESDHFFGEPPFFICQVD